MYRKILLFCLIVLTLLFGNNSLALAQDRVFLDLSLDFIDSYQLTQKNYQDTVVGGLSGITYNPQKDEYYAISDDRSRKSPARFYTLKINLDNNKINNIKIEGVTLLKNRQGELYPNNTIDAEGIAFSPRNSVFISSEGVSNRQIPPFINEYDLNGNLLSEVPIPKHYIYDQEKGIGVQDNYGFESLTIKANGTMKEDPFRLFSATELALTQDFDRDKNINSLLRSRLMHYVVNPFGQPVLIAEHLYPVATPNFGVVANGLSALFALPQEGYILSLERTLGLRGFGAKIFQIVMGNASDISNEESLGGNIDNINPLKKKLLLDLKDLDVKLDNLEGMTFGGKLPDGSQSLILVSDDNFAPERQKTQFLLFTVH